MLSLLWAYTKYSEIVRTTSMVVCVDSTLWESFIHPLTMYGGSFSTLFCHTSPKEQINQVHSCCSFFFFSPCVTLQYKIQWLKITQPFSEHPKSHKSGQMEICLLFTLKRSKNDADTVFFVPTSHNMQMPILKYFLYLSPAFISECRNHCYFSLLLFGKWSLHHKQSFCASFLAASEICELHLWERSYLLGTYSWEWVRRSGWSNDFSPWDTMRL